MRMYNLIIILSLTVLARCIVDKVPENVFSRGELDYRNLVLDTNSASLYVGARNRIYRLWAYNINDTSGNLFAEKRIVLPSSELAECRATGSTDTECQPSTRFMSLMDQKETLYVCSSVGGKPEVRVLEAGSLKDRQDPRTEIGICAPDSTVNATAVLVEWGNPEEIPSVYSGIRAGMSGENHLIYRPVLSGKGKEVSPSMRTVYTDNKWLYEPQFVNSFDVGEHVFFFFRELAVEASGPERIVYSRVARVCKKDMGGGRSLLRQVWTSFVKARLNCSLPGQFPFYFNSIQSVFRVDSSDDTVFYASMSTGDTAFGTSAVCVFSLKMINQLFNHGLFMERSGGQWLPVPADVVPAHRPGTCVSKSQTLTDSELHFAASHLLMAEPVSGGTPMIPTRDVVFDHVVVDKRQEQNVVFAMDGRRNELWKVSHWTEGSRSQWRLIERRTFDAKGTVTAAVLLPGEFLFTASPRAVTQYALASCSLHHSCALCSIDPYCSWNIAKAVCYAREKAHTQSLGWVSSWAGRGSADCAAAATTLERRLLPSDSVVLRGAESSVWKRRGERLKPDDKTHMTLSGDVVLLDVQSDDEGDYECELDGLNIVKYRVIVDDQECVRPRTVEALQSCWRDHCKRKEEHDQAMRHWTDQRQKASQCQINESQTSNVID